VIPLQTKPTKANLAQPAPLPPHSHPTPPHQTKQPSKATPQKPTSNLARLDEGVLDLELVEAAVRHVDETGGDGAILVFLPGGVCLRGVLGFFSSII
jgi:hypothetical protein